MFNLLELVRKKRIYKDRIDRYRYKSGKPVSIKVSDDTVTCGLCGTVNLYGVDNCIRCGVDFTWKYER